MRISTETTINILKRIKDYKDKLSNARAKAFYFNQESNQEQSSKEDDSGELKSNTPITTLDWHPY